MMNKLKNQCLIHIFLSFYFLLKFEMLSLQFIKHFLKQHWLLKRFFSVASYWKNANSNIMGNILKYICLQCKYFKVDNLMYFLTVKIIHPLSGPVKGTYKFTKLINRTSLQRTQTDGIKLYKFYSHIFL